MIKSQALKLITTHRIVAIIRLNDLSHARRLCEALFAGGIRVFELTLTNPDAFDVLADLRAEMALFDSGDAAIGLGSIRTLEQAQRSIDVGAQFLVSPILLTDMIALGQRENILTAPAAFTPTEIERAHQAGADVIKVFPVDTLGAKYIKGVLAPMPDLRLMPTGGVNVDNVADYIKAGAVAVGVGGAMVNAEAINAQDWDRIEATARQFVDAIGG